MGILREFTCVLILISLQFSYAQFPPRLQIPGAVPLQGSRPAPPRLQRINSADFIPTRARRPVGPIQREGVREIRPVVEEEEENYPPSITSFDAEVNKLNNLATPTRQTEEEEEQTLRSPSQPFRPERPVPIAREQIREKSVEVPRQPPLSISRPIPQNRPISKQIRPVVRQELDVDDDDIVARQAVRPKVRQSSPQQFRQAAPQRPLPRPQQLEDDEFSRRKKPVIQILRKYRNDNDDGSITWGFENDDGTFKEETLGTDCIIRGKYGYVDPDGVRRDFQYEAGNKCDPNQREEIDGDEDEIDTRISSKQPAPRSKPQYQQQFRPQ